MSFTKLDSKITSSSLWDQPDHVVRVWIAFLAEKDENGFVRGTTGSMKRTCNVTDDPDGKKFDFALKILESPDENSRTKDFDGRRIERVDGGWMVLNHEKYRLHEDIIKEQNRERVKRFRENQRLTQDVTQCNVTVPLRNVTGALHSVSVSESVSASVSESEEGMQGEKPPEPEKPTEINPDYRSCSELLKKRVQECRQAKIDEIKLKAWDTDVRLMVERDKRTTEQIIAIITECHDMQPRPGSGFTWRDQILSMSTLRRQWNDGKIFIGMNKMQPTGSVGPQLEFQRKALGKYDNLPKASN